MNIETYFPIQSPDSWSVFVLNEGSFCFCLLFNIRFRFQALYIFRHRGLMKKQQGLKCTYVVVKMTQKKVIVLVYLKISRTSLH